MQNFVNIVEFKTSELFYGTVYVLNPLLEMCGA